MKPEEIKLLIDTRKTGYSIEAIHQLLDVIEKQHEALVECQKELPDKHMSQVRAYNKAAFILKQYAPYAKLRGENDEN